MPTLHLAGIHYHLKLQFPDAPGVALYITLHLSRAARTQLQHLRHCPLSGAPQQPLLQARLAATSRPLVEGIGEGGLGLGDDLADGGAELWAVWRPRNVVAREPEGAAARARGRLGEPGAAMSEVTPPQSSAAAATTASPLAAKAASGAAQSRTQSKLGPGAQSTKPGAACAAAGSPPAGTPAAVAVTPIGQVLKAGLSMHDGQRSLHAWDTFEGAQNSKGPSLDPAPTATPTPLAPFDASSIHIPVDASDEASVNAALRRATAAAMGNEGPSSAAAARQLAVPGGSSSDAAIVQALPVQRLRGVGGGGGGLPADVAAGGLLWPPDHMALFPLGLQTGTSRARGSAQDEVTGGGVVLELHLLRYGSSCVDGAGSSTGGGGGSRSIRGASAGASGVAERIRKGAGGSAMEALRRTRQEQEEHAKQPHQQLQVQVPGQGHLQGSQGQLPRSFLLARLELNGDMLPGDRPGESVIMDGLQLVAPGGGSAGTATVEAVCWTVASFMAQLKGLAGPEKGGGRGLVEG